jgi:hypothetical protein
VWGRVGFAACLVVGQMRCPATDDPLFFAYLSFFIYLLNRYIENNTYMCYPIHLKKGIYCPSCLTKMGNITKQFLLDNLCVWSGISY